jgi:hypothetical protein
MDIEITQMMVRDISILLGLSMVVKLVKLIESRH